MSRLLGGLLGAFIAGSMVYTLGKIFGDYKWKEFMPPDWRVAVCFVTLIGGAIGSCDSGCLLENGNSCS